MKQILPVVASLILTGLWHAGHVDTCFSGRYGRYENWPSISDWEELLWLLTGKHSYGWGWGSGISGDYGFSTGGIGGGGGGFTNTPWKSALDPYYSPSVSSSSGGYGGSSSSGGVGLNTNKLKEVLSNYFKNKSKAPITIKTPGSSLGSSYGPPGNHYGDGNGIGESFPDTPGPGPAYPHHLPHDDGPLPYGPPYDSVSNWAHDGAGGHSSGAQGLHGDKWPSHNDHPAPHDHHHFGSHHNDHDYNSHGPPDPHQHHGPPDDHHRPSYHHSDNQFKADYDVFGGHHESPGGGGGFFNKKRRHGRRRRVHHAASSSAHGPHHEPSSHAPVRAGLPTKPMRRKPFPKKLPATRRMSYRQQRRRPLPPRRRMINTKFGGYKVDHSRLRYG